MLKLFQRFIFKKFILLIGDSGARLTLFEKGIPTETIEISSIKDEKISNLASLLRKYSKVPVYILADVSEQNFKHFKIPSTNPIIIKKLLQRRITRDFDKSDLNNYTPFKDKDDLDKSSSHFIITNISRVPPLSDWLEYLKEFQNTVDAVYSVPVELFSLSKSLEPFLKKKGIAITTSRWKMVIIQNKISGFRIIVTKDSQLIFSRLLNFDTKNFDKENIEALKNQIIGTVEYLRRIGFKDKHGISVFLLLYNELNSSFDTSSIKGYNFIKVSQEDFASVVYEKKIPPSRVNSIEQDISNYFIHKGQYLSFYTKSLEIVSSLTNVNLGMTLVSMFGVFFLILFLLLTTKSVNGSRTNIEKMLFAKSKLSTKLETIRQEKFGFDINEDKVIDVSKLHKMLNDEIADPLEIIMKLSGIKPSNIKVKTFSWKYVSGKETSFDLDGMFVSKNLSYEGLFTKYDGFIRELKTEFHTYNVEHSELPDTIDFDANLEDIPINFKIDGPNN